MGKALIAAFLLACRPSAAFADDPSAPQPIVYTRNESGNFVLAGQEPPQPIPRDRVIQLYKERRAELNLPLDNDQMFQSFKNFIEDPARADQLQSLTLDENGGLVARFKDGDPPTEVDFSFKPGQLPQASEASFTVDPDDPESRPEPLVRRDDGTLGAHPDHEIPQETAQLKVIDGLLEELTVWTTVLRASDKLPTREYAIVSPPEMKIYGTYGQNWRNDNDGGSPGKSDFYWNGKYLMGWDAKAKEWRQAGWGVTAGGKTMVFLHGVEAFPGDARRPAAAGLKDTWMSHWALYALPAKNDTNPTPGYTKATKALDYHKLDMAGGKIVSIGTRQAYREVTIGCGRGPCQRVKQPVSIPVRRLVLDSVVHKNMHEKMARGEAQMPATGHVPLSVNTEIKLPQEPMFRVRDIYWAKVDGKALEQYRGLDGTRYGVVPLVDKNGKIVPGEFVFARLNISGSSVPSPGPGDTPGERPAQEEPGGWDFGDWWGGIFGGGGSTEGPREPPTTPTGRADYLLDALVPDNKGVSYRTAMKIRDLDKLGDPQLAAVLKGGDMDKVVTALFNENLYQKGADEEADRVRRARAAILLGEIGIARPDLADGIARQLKGYLMIPPSEDQVVPHTRRGYPSWQEAMAHSLLRMGRYDDVFDLAAKGGPYGSHTQSPARFWGTVVLGNHILTVAQARKGQQSGEMPAQPDPAVSRPLTQATVERLRKFQEARIHNSQLVHLYHEHPAVKERDPDRDLMYRTISRIDRHLGSQGPFARTW